MKTTRMFLLALAVLWASPAVAKNTSGSPLPPVPKFNTKDAKAHGRAIAEYADRIDSGWIDQYSRSQMTLIDAHGDKVTREVRLRSLEGKDGDKSIARFMSPAEVRGVAALTHEHPKSTDDSWLYLPSSRRVRRVSGANRTASFQGTEFTYEDLASIIVSRYKWTFLAKETVKIEGKSHPVFKIEARPTYKSTGYSKLIMYIHAKHYRSEKTEFYDRAGVLLKTLEASAWKQHHGRFWRANKLTMKNHQSLKRTLLEIKTQFLNLSLYKKRDGSPRKNLTDANFTRRSLENG